LRNLRTKFERFCLRNRNKGIPNLMLYIVLASGLVAILPYFTQSNVIYEWLCFDKAAILRGQVWRLVTYVFTYAPGSNLFMVLIGLYFFYNISRHVEAIMGTLRFNIYYFSGVLLMDIFALIFCPTEPVIIGQYLYPAEYFTNYVYANMALYLHMGLVLTYCTTNPDAQFLVFFIIPVRAWFISLIDLLLIILTIVGLSTPVFLFPHNLFPLVGVANFLLFAGRDVLNLLPPAMRPSPYRVQKPTKKRNGTIPFVPKSKTEKTDYTHKCTVCGRTDTSNPELEFRYCSRCHGYHCYCQDHISNHPHIEE